MKTIQLKKIYILLSVLSLITVCSCNKDEKVVAPIISNEGLTTVQLQLTNTANAEIVTAQWEQLLDNNGNPLSPDLTQTTLKLKANMTYSAKLIALDKTQDPVFNVSDEIKARSAYHLFFYQPLATTLPLVIPNNYPADMTDLYPAPIPTPIPAQSALNLTVTITDQDSGTQHYPLGLESTFASGAASTGWLRILLRHQPNQKNGTFAPGATDLDVGFAVEIK